MPVFARFLLKNYFKVFFLTVFSFITILLVSRLEEIAHFATTGAKISYLALFILYQIPYILPIAIPIACLISAMILFQQISHTQELTALRAGGLPLKTILSPLLVAAFFIAFFNFFIVSEIATTSHLATRRMAYDVTSVNPLVLLQNAKIAKLQGAYVQMDPVKSGESAQDLLIALNQHGHLTLFLAKEVEMHDKSLIAEHVTLLTSTSEKDFDNLIIENQQSTVTSAAEFASLLKQKGWKIANDHLTLRLLRVRKEQLHKELKEKNESNDVWKIRHNIKKCKSELIRRFALGFAAFTFTLMGSAFGMDIGRNRNKKSIFMVLGLTSLTLIAFFIGKELDHLIIAAAFCFLFPHILIIGSSMWTLRRVAKGIE